MVLSIFFPAIKVVRRMLILSRSYEEFGFTESQVSKLKRSGEKFDIVRPTDEAKSGSVIYSGLMGCRPLSPVLLC
jgi:hypothetical protein